MRHICGLALVITTFALSGCVSSALDSLSSLQNGCTTSTSSVSCGSPQTPVVTPPATTPPTTPPVTNTNTGNTSGITTGDTTLALESNVPISTTTNPAVSNLAVNPLTGAAPTIGSTNSFTINTNTASNSSWPITKTMTYYPAGATTSPAVNGTAAPLVDNPKYAEYRFYQKGGYDEELQVWSWTDSYATQYRDVTNSGTAPVHQAWSFGGNYTPIANLPTTNVPVTYNGSWTGTAQTSGWLDTSDQAQTVSYNNNWQVNGTSALTVNFGTKAFQGTLTPTQWVGVNKNNQLEIVTPGSGTLNSQVPFITTPGTTTAPNVVLTGTLATSTKAGTPSNQITGNAGMDNAVGWISPTTGNPLYAGVFGTNATEVAGVFALSSAFPHPFGGNTAINNDGRGFISMSGMFHGQ